MMQGALENRHLADKTGKTSHMVFIPRFDLCEVIPGGSPVPHPAFVLGDRILPGIYISKYQNVMEEGLAYSRQGQDPATSVSFDQAAEACAAKGDGWHLMSALEWGALALWCLKHDQLPFGNNHDGKDYREDAQTATVAFADPTAGIIRIATGTGPITWSHNRREDGIYDLNGNIWEWQGGIRLVRGELQLLPPALTNDSSADSLSWRAINAHTGELLFPDGTGTTSHSIKLDYQNGVWCYTEAINDAFSHARYCDFLAVTAPGLSPAAKELLCALGCLWEHPCQALEGVSLYANNGAAERMVFRGGRWGQQHNAGVFKNCFDDPRSYAGPAVGFRAAYHPPLDATPSKEVL